jgi:SPP1 family phage portal protein
MKSKQLNQFTKVGERMNTELLKAFAILKRTGLTKELWQSIENAFATERDKHIKNYEAYTAEKLEIHSRKFEDEKKINNKLVNSYRSKIVDQCTGYLFGNAIKYDINGNKYAETLYEKHSERLNDFLVMNTIDDLDAETGRLMGVNGKAYRLVYTDTEGYDLVKKLKASQVIYFDEDNAIWFYERVNEHGQVVQVIEYYRPTTYNMYELNNETNAWTIVHENKLHNYDYMPIIQFLNNDEAQNDFFVVETLIDAYDRLISDTSSEFEQFRLAYMAFINASIDKETIEQMKQTGAFSLQSNNGEAVDVKFVTKDVNVSFVDWLEKKLEENIYDFSNSIDMSDEKFSGSAQSGESRKYKLIPLETKATLKERKFRKGLRRMFKVLCSKWNKANDKLDYLDIMFSFNRKLPVDLSYAGDVLNKLSPYLSQQTLLSQLEFVSDPNAEMERKRQEEEENNRVFGFTEEEGE